MAAQGGPKTRARVRLSTERVLRAAIDVADRGGIDALTMRNLARKLGVEAMTLYYYVAKKDDILSGIVDLVVSEIEVPSDEDHWKVALRTSAVSAHNVLLRHPWACGLMMSPARIRSARMRYMESLLARLRNAGFSAETTLYAYHALDSHILGFTMWELGYTAGMKELAADFGTRFRRELPVDSYPYLVEHFEEHVRGSKRNGGESEFEFGLDLILDGLEMIRVSAKPVTRARQRARTGTRRARRQPHPSC
jgi:AcrR family transcriptional regulator